MLIRIKLLLLLLLLQNILLKKHVNIIYYLVQVKTRNLNTYAAYVGL